jgi:APA family basic amino acid/polyamine antiporter
MTSQPPRGQLLRILGPFDGLAIVVGIIIGVGILRAPGLIASYLGSPWLILLMWVIGGIMVMMSTLTLAELSAMFPRAGGKYLYAREAFGDVTGFAVGWAELAGIRAFTASSKAVVFGGYMVALIGFGSAPVFAGTVVVLLFLIHMVGLRAGSLLQNFISAIKVLLLIAVVGVALWLGNGASWREGASMVPQAGLATGVVLAYQQIWFTYYGWEDPRHDDERPRRDEVRRVQHREERVRLAYPEIDRPFVATADGAGRREERRDEQAQS